MLNDVLKERQYDKERIKELEEKLKGKTDNTNKLIEVTNLYLNSVPTALIKEKIEEIKKYRDIAKELIEERVVIADSDSLNYGRAEAHDKDIQALEELLKKGE